MTSRGTVRVWHAEEGWGVLDSAATPGGCWTHYSAVLVPGYRALDPGGAVKFTFEAAEQDGYSFRAVEVWPADQEPVRNHDEVSGASSAYHSTLTLTFDDDDETRGLALDARARTRQAAGMADPRYAVPLDEFVAGAQIAREEQVEEHAERVVPTPAHGDRLPYGDGMTGDVDGD